jgi:hypothetical protein
MCGSWLRVSELSRGPVRDHRFRSSALRAARASAGVLQRARVLPATCASMSSTTRSAPIDPLWAWFIRISVSVVFGRMVPSLLIH